MKNLFGIRIVRAIALLALSVMPISQASADYQLNYVGTPFAAASGAYDTTMRVTASFVLTDTLYNSLAGNAGQAVVYAFTTLVPGLVSYQVNDGVQSFSNLADLNALVLTISSTNDVTNWAFASYSGITGGEVCSQSNPAVSTCVGDSVRDIGGIAGSVGYNALAPGTWTVTSVPEPETYAMMIAGLGLLGFLARRRKQQIAA